MKKIGAMVLTAVAVSSLAGCASAPASDDGTTITVWGWRNEEPWVKLIESYSAEGVTVEYKSYKSDEYNSVLQTGLASSSGPDIVMLRSYGGLDTLVAGGEIAALPEDFAGLQNIPANLVDGVRSVTDDKVYGVPFQSVTANVLYNKTLFEEHDLDVPETWDDFIALSETLKNEGVTPLAAGAHDSWILPIYRDLFGASDYNGPELAEKMLDGTTDFTDPGYAAANERLLELQPYFPAGYEALTYVDANALFSSGKAAMYPGGIWELTNFQKAMPDVELGLFNPPRANGSGEPFAMGYLDGAIGMSARLEGAEKDAALAYLEWIGSAEFGEGVANDLLAIPAVDGVEPSDPLLAEAAKQFAANPTPYLTYVHFDYGTPSGTTLEYDNLQKMMIGQITPAEVGEAVQAGISQWFEPGNG